MSLFIAFISTINIALGYALAVYLGKSQFAPRMRPTAMPPNATGSIPTAPSAKAEAEPSGHASVPAPSPAPTPMQASRPQPVAETPAPEAAPEPVAESSAEQGVEAPAPSEDVAMQAEAAPSESNPLDDAGPLPGPPMPEVETDASPDPSTRAPAIMPESADSVEPDSAQAEPTEEDELELISRQMLAAARQPDPDSLSADTVADNDAEALQGVEAFRAQLANIQLEPAATAKPEDANVGETAASEEIPV